MSTKNFQSQPTLGKLHIYVPKLIVCQQKHTDTEEPTSTQTNHTWATNSKKQATLLENLLQTKMKVQTMNRLQHMEVKWFDPEGILNLS